MKRKPKIFYHPIEGSAPLAIYWYQDPYGDALESKEGSGVYFASPNGEILGVQFDDVNEHKDEQSLTTKAGTRVRIVVKAGKITVKLDDTKGRVA